MYHQFYDDYSLHCITSTQFLNSKNLIQQTLNSNRNKFSLRGWLIKIDVASFGSSQAQPRQRHKSQLLLYTGCPIFGHRACRAFLEIFLIKVTIVKFVKVFLYFLRFSQERALGNIEFKELPMPYWSVINPKVNQGREDEFLNEVNRPES